MTPRRRGLGAGRRGARRRAARPRRSTRRRAPSSPSPTSTWSRRSTRSPSTRALDPRDSLLVAGGGAAGLNIVPIARELGCRRCSCRARPARSARCGGQYSDVVAEFSASCFTDTAPSTSTGSTPRWPRLDERSTTSPPGCARAAIELDPHRVLGRGPLRLPGLGARRAAAASRVPRRGRRRGRWTRRFDAAARARLRRHAAGPADRVRDLEGAADRRPRSAAEPLAPDAARGGRPAPSRAAAAPASRDRPADVAGPRGGRAGARGDASKARR